MAVIEMSLKELEYERLKNILSELKESARYVYLYEDSVIADYRNMAEFYKKDIIDTLLVLEI